MEISLTLPKALPVFTWIKRACGKVLLGTVHCISEITTREISKTKVLKMTAVGVVNSYLYLSIKNTKVSDFSTQRGYFFWPLHIKKLT